MRTLSVRRGSGQSHDPHGDACRRKEKSVLGRVYQLRVILRSSQLTSALKWMTSGYYISEAVEQTAKPPHSVSRPHLVVKLHPASSSLLPRSPDPDYRSANQHSHPRVLQWPLHAFSARSSRASCTRTSSTWHADKLLQGKFPR